MTYYHSGVNQYGHVNILDDEGVAGMVNATSITQPKMKRALKEFDLSLVLDSGAFQGFDDVEAYVDILSDIGDRFEWYANLDVIGDQMLSNRHQGFLEERGFDPLWVYQVDGIWSIEDCRHVLNKYDFVGIGGLVPHAFESPTDLVRRIDRIGKTLEETDTEAHFFGMGSPSVLHHFQKAPWFRSADSQKWLAGKRSRTIYTLRGERINSTDLSFTGEECARQNLRQIEEWASTPRDSLFDPHIQPEQQPT